MVTNRPKRQNILGVQVSAINMSQVISQVEEWIEMETPSYICVTPAHGVMDCYNNPAIKMVFNHSGMTTPDGMAIVWLLNFTAINM